MLLQPDLLHYADSLKTKSIQGKTYLWDLIRRKYIVLQPEEIVRQLMVTYLIHEHAYPRGRMQVERGLAVNDTKRRYDILVRDQHLQPYLLVECKAFDISLNQSTYDQAALYNSDLQAPYLLITNGKATYCAKINYDDRTYEMTEIPTYGLAED